MRAALVLFGAACLAVVAVAGCPRAPESAQAAIADTIGVAANAGLPALVAAYRGAGRAAIEGARDREDAVGRLSAVENRWEPVWRAWELFRLAHDAWSQQLEAGADAGASRRGAVEAFCRLRGLARPDVDLPAVPGVGCAP